MAPTIRKKLRASGVPITIIHGVPGVGKTTAALSWPDPILIPVEDKRLPTTRADKTPLEVDAYEKPKTYTEFLEQLNDAAKLVAEGEYKTIVIDALDKLEPLVWDHVCKANSWTSIEEAGYGAGYTAATNEWFELMTLLRDINKELNAYIVIVGHSDVATFSPPGMKSYARYMLRLHKKAVNIFIDDADAIFFLNHDVSLKKTEGGFGKTNVHAEGAGARVLQTDERPAVTAKNAVGLPGKIYLEAKKDVWPQIASYFEAKK